MTTSAAQQISQMTNSVNQVALSEMSDVNKGLQSYKTRLADLIAAAPGLFNSSQIASIQNAIKKMDDASNSVGVALSATAAVLPEKDGPRLVA